MHKIKRLGTFSGQVYFSRHPQINSILFRPYLKKIAHKEIAISLVSLSANLLPQYLIRELFMTKPTLLLIHPAQDKDRLGSRRRRQTSMPKLNLPLLAAYADNRFEVRIVDETVDDIDFDCEADLVGITVLTQLAKRAYEVAEMFRERGAKIVMGGFHVNFFPDEAELHADAIVVGEADTVWNELLDDFLAGKIKKRYKADIPHDLKGLPRPRLDLMRRSAYSTANVIETARGCPHRCAYCAVTLFWGHKFRFRPIAEVIDEVRAMPPGDIVFVDDNIIGSPKRAKELFKAMIPLKRSWYSQADMKLANDPELLELCAASGCKWLFMGIESINAANLKEVSKSRVNAVEKYEKSIGAIKDAGINIFGSFIFGLDHDDTSVFANTVDFCVDNRLPGANFYILTPLPFTKLFDEMEKEGRIIHKDWSRYDMNHVVFQPKLMSPDELMQGYLSAYRSFYSWRSIAKRVLRPQKNLTHLLAFNAGRNRNYRHFKEGCLM